MKCGSGEGLRCRCICDSPREFREMTEFLSKIESIDHSNASIPTANSNFKLSNPINLIPTLFHHSDREERSYLILLASLSLSIKTRTSLTLTGPYHISHLSQTFSGERGIHNDIPNHGPLPVVHEFNTDLLNVTSGPSASEDFHHTRVPGGMLFDVD